LEDDKIEREGKMRGGRGGCHLLCGRKVEATIIEFFLQVSGYVLRCFT
jgi:hypothetical protein